MAEILQRHRIIVIAIGFIMIAALVWLFISRHNANKIPSRGVFVMGYHYGTCMIHDNGCTALNSLT